MRPLTDYRVLTFDCYGTLIDWECGIWDAFQPLMMRNLVTGLTREAVLRVFAQCESRQEQSTPNLRYPELLTLVHARMAKRLGMKTDARLDAAFGSSLPHWPAFPDTADALRILKQYYKLVIISNVHRDGIAESVRKLGVEFDAVYTAEDIGSYKPADANFEYLLAHLKSDLGLERSDVLHTAQSLYHDHIPAKKFGVANAWIDRQRLSEGGDWGATEQVEVMPAIDYIFFSLGEMAEAVAGSSQDSGRRN